MAVPILQTNYLPNHQSHFRFYGELIHSLRLKFHQYFEKFYPTEMGLLSSMLLTGC